MKTMLELLDELSQDEGSLSWDDACNRGNHDINLIPQVAGKMYHNQFNTKWNPCKFGDVLPVGHYMVKLSINGIESENYMLIDEVNNSVWFYRAIEYFKIELPKP